MSRGANPLDIFGQPFPVGADLVQVGKELGKQLLVGRERGWVQLMVNDVVKKSSLNVCSVIAHETRRETLGDKVRHEDANSLIFI